jgi:hypothetical protein
MIPTLNQVTVAVLLISAVLMVSHLKTLSLGISEVADESPAWF